MDVFVFYGLPRFSVCFYVESGFSVWIGNYSQSAAIRYTEGRGRIRILMAIEGTYNAQEEQLKMLQVYEQQNNNKITRKDLGDVFVFAQKATDGRRQWLTSGGSCLLWRRDYG